MPAKIGLDCKLYYKPGGQAAAAPATWLELANAKDVSVSLETGDADVTTRANNGWKATVNTLKDASFEFEMIYDPTDAAFIAVREAFLNGTVLGLRILDGAIATTGTQGLSCDARIATFNIEQPLEDAVTVKVTAKPTYSATPPAWLTI